MTTVKHSSANLFLYFQRIEKINQNWALLFPVFSPLNTSLQKAQTAEMRLLLCLLPHDKMAIALFILFGMCIALGISES